MVIVRNFLLTSAEKVGKPLYAFPKSLLLFLLSSKYTSVNAQNFPNRVVSSQKTPETKRFIPLALPPTSDDFSQKFLPLSLFDLNSQKTPSWKPPHYFSKGALELNPHIARRSIDYLLTESDETPQKETITQVLEALEKLPRKGILRKNAQNFFFLDLPNEYITSLFSLLKEKSLMKPPYFHEFFTPEGAHLPVITAKEAAASNLEKLNELSQEFEFEVEGLYSVEPIDWIGIEKIWYLQISSKSLEDLREKYHLGPKLRGHSFSLVIALQARQAGQPHPMPIMRINPSFQVA